MSTPPISPVSSLKAATTTTPEVVWYARIWSFLTDEELRAIPCVSALFPFYLAVLKTKKATELAFFFQRRACQALDLAMMGMAEANRAPLYIDFRLQGASKIQPLPAILTAQKTEPIFTRTYNVDPNRYNEFDTKDHLAFALESAMTSYGLIKDAIESMTPEAIQAALLSDHSSEAEPQPVDQTPADPPYSSEVEEEEPATGNRTALPFHELYPPSTGFSRAHTQLIEGLSFHFDGESVGRRLNFTPATQYEQKSVLYTHPNARPPFPESPPPPSDPRWPAKVLKDLGSPTEGPFAVSFKRTATLDAPESALPPLPPSDDAEGDEGDEGDEAFSALTSLPPSSATPPWPPFNEGDDNDETF